MKWVFSVVNFLSFLFLLIPTPLLAAPDQPLNLVSSPLPILLEAKPGSTVTTEIRIKNAGSQPEQLRIDLYKFTARGEDGAPQLLDPDPADQSTSWVSFSQARLTAPPDEWQTIQMTIAPPLSASAGYYFAAAFQRAEAPKPEPGKASITGGTAILVLLDVPTDGTRRSAELLEFKADRRFYEYLPTTFTAKVRNTGNTHLAPHGNIFLLSGKKTIGTLEINAAPAGNILPNSNRSFTTDWTDGFPVYQAKMDNGKPQVDHKGEVVQALKWDFTQVPKLRIGHYSAKLVMVYNDGKRDVPLEATVSFWVVPWRLLLGVVVVLGLALVGLRTTLVNLGRRVKGKRRRNE